MKVGTELNSLAKKILAEARSKKDYAMDTRNLALTDDCSLQFKVGGETKLLKPTNRCLNQIGNRVGIPRHYLHRLETEAPALLAQNVNHWFQKAPEMRMLRTVQNGERVARAFLSHRYRPFDNADLVNAVLPRLIDAGCEVQSAEVTEKRLYIQAITPKLKGEVKKGDVVQAGVMICNSEVGCGSVRVEPLLFRLVCLNGMVLPTAMRRHHVGRAGEGEWEEGEASEVFSDATRKLDDKAFWAKVNDVVTDSLTQIKFKANLEKLQATTKIDIGEPKEAIEVLDKKFGFSDEENDSILNHLAKGGDMSLWGLANAVTRTAEDAESYDRAVDLERIGGEVIELPKTMFN